MVKSAGFKVRWMRNGQSWVSYTKISVVSQIVSQIPELVLSKSVRSLPLGAQTRHCPDNI